MSDNGKILYDLSFEEYLAIQAVSYSGVLKPMLKSPKHCRHAQQAKPTTTAAMANGSMVHTMILEPAAFERRYFVKPKVDGRTKEGKAVNAEAERLAMGREIVTEDAVAGARRMAECVRRGPDAGELLERGKREVTLLWTERGMQHKARIDWVATARRNEQPVLVDLKSARDIGERRFGAQAAQLAYDLQAVHYLRGYQIITGQEPYWRWLAVENVEPYDVAVYVMDGAVKENAQAVREDLLDRYQECLKSGYWPGQSPGVNPLKWPRWALPDDGDWEVTSEDGGAGGDGEV